MRVESMIFTAGPLRLGRHFSGLVVLAGLLLAALPARGVAETVTLVVESGAGPRVNYAAGQLGIAYENNGHAVVNQPTLPSAAEGPVFVIGNRHKSAILGQLLSGGRLTLTQDEIGPEGFLLAAAGGNVYVVAGEDDSGALYGCIELIDRLNTGRYPAGDLRVAQTPAMRLRGSCIGMQKPGLLPGRRVYEYPYTPENFPFFYDKQQWIEYLDMLTHNRMNTLYLWNGHPFASLVKLEDYPYAIEVSDEDFKKNQDIFHFLTEEANKRGIWVVQMFYNAFVSKPFAEHNNLESTQFSASTPLIADYNRKSIAKFVEMYPNVGVMACLGEALSGPENQKQWLNEVIIPGVKDGMAKLGLKEEPPIVIRAHTIGDPAGLIRQALPLYKNLYTESKFNGESLMTWQPRGKYRTVNRNLASSGGTHMSNMHLMSNLEPFRYGAQAFIQRCVQAMIDVEHVGGLHLYPMTYWNWPYSPDKTNPPIIQYKRDWIWFEAWGRYAWDPYRPEEQEHPYWVGRLASMYGSEKAGEWILAAYNNAGNCAPILIRRFGITEGNRQTLSLGMYLDQLVNARKYTVYQELYEAGAPYGERLDTYGRRDWADLPHVGETPLTAIREVMDCADRAVQEIDHAAQYVTANKAEFERLRNDIHCIQAMSQCFEAKVHAATHMLRYQNSNDVADMEKALPYMRKSMEAYRRLTDLTKDTYVFANSLQTGHRRIPTRGLKDGKPDYYHWTQMLPLYEKELADFESELGKLKNSGGAVAGSAAEAAMPALPRAKFTLVSKDAELYDVALGAKVFMDRPDAIKALAGGLNGLQGVRISYQAASANRDQPLEFEAQEPVQILVGYIKDPARTWLQVALLDADATANEQGGMDTVIENAATVDGLPAIDIHAYHYGAGRHKLDLHGRGAYIVLGVVPESAKLARRDAKLPAGR